MPQMIKCDKKAVIKDIKEDIKKRNFEKGYNFDLYFLIFYIISL